MWRFLRMNDDYEKNVTREISFILRGKQKNQK